MLPAIFNPKFYQGDSWDFTASFTQYISGSASAYDLTGYTARSQLRKSAALPAVVAEFQCFIDTPPSGLIRLYMHPSATANIPAGVYAWDLEISGSGVNSGTVKTLLYGQAAVINEVTR